MASRISKRLANIYQVIGFRAADFVKRQIDGAHNARRGIASIHVKAFHELKIRRLVMILVNLRLDKLISALDL